MRCKYYKKELNRITSKDKLIDNSYVNLGKCKAYLNTNMFSLIQVQKQIDLDIIW